MLNLIIEDYNIYDFEPWGCTAPLNFKKLKELGKLKEFSELLEGFQLDGIVVSKVLINDLLWFEFDNICEFLSIPIEEE